MRKKHKWHCGICHSPLLATKGKKGTKYLQCPQHGQIAYFNILPLLAPLLAAAAPSLIEKGGELVSGLFGGGDKKKSEAAPQRAAYRRKSSSERLLDLIEAERRI